MSYRVTKQELGKSSHDLARDREDVQENNGMDVTAVSIGLKRHWSFRTAARYDTSLSHGVVLTFPYFAEIYSMTEIHHMTLICVASRTDQMADVTISF
jgi:hypothetical protein